MEKHDCKSSCSSDLSHFRTLQLSVVVFVAFWQLQLVIVRFGYSWSLKTLKE